MYSYGTGQYRYLNEFVKLNLSGSDLLRLGIYPDAKEITEAYGVFNAIRTKLKVDLNDKKIVFVSVGDGRSPRTAALTAFRTKWKCISVDPGLNTNYVDPASELTWCDLWESNIERLQCIPKYVEDVDISADRIVIAATHSHAPLQSILKHVRGKVRSLVAMPCCIPYEHEFPPSLEYRDAGVWSPKNKIMVWKSI